MIESNFETYLRMHYELDEIRTAHNGAESEEEDKLLDEMDKVWDSLTKTEKSILDSI